MPPAELTLARSTSGGRSFRESRRRRPGHVRRRLAELGDVDDGRRAGSSREAAVDAADVVAFDEKRLIARIGLAFADGVVVDLGGNRLQRRQVLDFLDADDVGRLQHMANRQRRLVQPVVERRRRQRDVADAGSFTVSKKRSMLNDATVNSSAVAERTAVTVRFGVVAVGGAAGSVRIV